MHLAAPGKHEYEIEALIREVFRRNASERTAYAPIVGSGPNATVIHYRANRRKMEDGDLVLVDAGCELDYYASDVTRTFPVGSTFSGGGKAIYELVLAAQQAAIDAVRPGARFDEPHQAALRVLAAGLVELGILAASADEVLEKELYKPVYMHRTSHWLGMDVHDVGVYKQRDGVRVLEPGMVLTVEPGLYVADHLEDIDAKWHGIGVRIEDDVLVTPQGHEVLTAAVPKQVADIEALRVGAAS